MKRNKLVNAAILVAILGIFLVSPVLAGDGNGSGGGRNEPLALLSSSPASGQQDVPITSSIFMEFTTNVVNMSVKDGNSKCFALYASQQPVAIEVVMADDQIEPENKDYVTVVPVEPLEPGTVYSLRISPDLTSKSGVSLGKETVVSFTTAGVAEVDSSPSPNTSLSSVQEVVGTSQVPVEGDPKPAESDPVEKDISSMKPAEESETDLDEEPASQLAVQEGNSQAASDGGDSNYLLLIALIVVIVSLGFYSYRRKNPPRGKGE